MQIILGIFEHFQNAPGGPVVTIFAYIIILLALIMAILIFLGISKKQKEKENKITQPKTTDDKKGKEILPGVYSFNHNEGTLTKISTGYKKLINTLKAGEYQMPSLNSEEFSFFG